MGNMAKTTLRDVLGEDGNLDNLTKSLSNPLRTTVHPLISNQIGLRIKSIYIRYYTLYF